MITAVFVYGTLKRGQCRASQWPAEPLALVPAWTRGCLFHRSDYPAMTTGEDRVVGEWWKFSTDEMPRVLATLDEIEGTNQPDQRDLYLRVTAPVWDLQDHPLEQAFTYFYATDPIADGFVQLRPAADDKAVRWPE